MFMSTISSGNQSFSEREFRLYHSHQPIGDPHGIRFQNCPGISLSWLRVELVITGSLVRSPLTAVVKEGDTQQ